MIIVVVIIIGLINLITDAGSQQMHWYERIGYVGLAGVLVSGIATIAPAFTTNRTAVHVLAPIVSLPFVLRVLFDIASEYELVPESSAVSTRGLLVASMAGGAIGGGSLYIYIQATMPVPPILTDSLLSVAFIAEWLVAYVLVIFRIRSSSDTAPRREPDTH